MLAPCLASVSSEKLVSAGNSVCIRAQDQPEQNCHRFRISSNLANLGLMFATKERPQFGPFCGRGISECGCGHLADSSISDALNHLYDKFAAASVEDSHRSCTAGRTPGWLRRL